MKSPKNRLKAYFEGISISMVLVLAGLAPGGGSANPASPRELPQPRHEVVLEVRGNISNVNAHESALFDMAMLQQLPAYEVETTTVVTDGKRRFVGFLMRDLLDLVGAGKTTVTATALNDYVVQFDVEEFHTFDVMVAYAMDGVALSPRDKGPLWIVYPRDAHPELQDIRYDYRWVWQLRRLEVQ